MTSSAIQEEEHLHALRLGLVLGVAVGCLDGVRALLYPNGAPTRELLTLLWSMTSYGLVMGGLLLGLQRLFRRKGASSTPAALSGIMRLLLLSGGMSLGLAGMAFGLHALLSVQETSAKLHQSVLLLALLTGVSLVGLLLSPEAGVRLQVRGALTFLLLGSLSAAGGLFIRPDLRQAIERHASQGVLEPAATGAQGRPNIVLIVLDTVRADHLSLYGYARDTTPFLKKLATRGLVYEQAISPAPWTVPSHASLFTGMPPSIHRADNAHRWLDDDWVTLAEALQGQGYRTVALSSNSWVGPTFNLHQGFQTLYEVYRLPSMQAEDPLQRLMMGGPLVRLLGPPPRADKGGALLNTLAQSWLEQAQAERSLREQPYFMFINLVEPHLPYDAPEPYRSRYLNKPLSPVLKGMFSSSWMQTFRLVGMQGALDAQELPQLAALYDGGLAYTDALLQQLFEGLEARGGLENTLVVITSDHGENLGEHEGLLDHVFSVHQSVLHVPLLVVHPDFAPGKRYAGLVSTSSIFPTLLEYAGVNLPPAPVAYLSTLPRSLDAPPLDHVVSEYDLPLYELSLLSTEVPGFDVAPLSRALTAIQDGRYKWVESQPGAPQLFDLQADPQERLPQPPQREEGSALAQALAQWRQQGGLEATSERADIPDGQVPDGRATHTRAPAAGPAPVPLDEDTRASLRALGYVQ